MMPYRAGSPVAPLVVVADAFPRKNVGVLTALVIALAVTILVVPPLLVLGVSRGMSPFRAGGAGMFVLLALSAALATGTALAGWGAVRGRHRWGAVLVALPALPVLAGALFGTLGMKRVFGAIDAAPLDTDVAMRLLSLGLAETDTLPAYGVLIGAVACGAGACSLLASAASVDRTQNQAPAGAAWAAPAAFGGLAFIVSIVMRIAMRSGFATLPLAVPSLLIITGLACAAAVNAPLVRHWREPRETDAWIAALFAAALLAAGGFFLLSLGASYLSEARTLAVVYGPTIDPSQRAALLASVADEQGSYRVIGIVDGVLAFFVIGTPALAGLGRAANGRLRFPRGAPIFVALGGAAVVLATLIAARTWEFGRIEASAARPAEAADGLALELPRVPVTGRLLSPEDGAAVVRVDAKGKATVDASRPSLADSTVLVIVADRRAHWEDVVKAIRDARKQQALPTISTIELRVTLLDKADRSQLGPYGPLLGNETSALRVSLGAPLPRSAYDTNDDAFDRRGASARDALIQSAMRPRNEELMDGIAAAITKRPRSALYDDSLALLPPEGSW